MTETDRAAIRPGLYDASAFVPRTALAEPGDAADAALAAAMPAPDTAPAGRWRRRFLRLLLACVGAALALQLFGFIAAAAALAPGLGWAAAALVGATLAAGALWARAEHAEFRRIARVEALQAEGRILLAAGAAGAADGWIVAVTRQLATTPTAAPGLARLQAMAIDGYAAGDALRLFEREALAGPDRAALAAVARAARDCAVGTAASPLAALDALIVALRALAMIRAVAGCYGFRPGGLAALALLRRAVSEAAGVAGADLAADLGAEFLGGLGHKLAGSLSARLGVGVFAGLRVARLGLATMRACRPLPFLAAQPQVAQVLRAALGWPKPTDAGG